MGLRLGRPLASLPALGPCTWKRPRPRHASSVSASKLQFGQPVHETHPHLLQAGQVTPGITAQEYASRRAAFARLLPRRAVAVLPAAPLLFKSGAVFHPYRQESNFFWLTGWDEPDALALIENLGPNPDDHVFHMFVKPKDPVQEQWSGYRNGVDAAQHVFNADKAYSIHDAPDRLPSMLASASHVYAQDGALGPMMPRSSLATTPLSPLLNKLRVIKSPAEVANMRKAGQLSGRAITDAMRRPWAREKELHAFLDYTFITNGCQAPAYIPVVAGGENANCIHYTANNNTIGPNDLILVDAGGEYGTYISDISRTWPASGRFSPAQRDLYEAVLAVQRDAVSLCRESANNSLEQIHHATAHALVARLRDISFDISLSSIHKLFPHHVGHYIGLDVHDCPGYTRCEPLISGHCVTIEPGVYVPHDDRWPRHFHGMGIRIEDSVCVDKDAPYILSTEAVKEVDDIEALPS
ncbi:hypothetical protein CDD82_5226 [Ophiocordyceps australis]|uniref:Xaa-Pro aminopeptidase n=1 Tax=Ophiocordyceps australis TaxID=1399860 RepID=A0A2C5Z2I2_9HYPO|nr:hypothetical protein CDD82_5226 [Ophiocordyceps australis]